MATPSTADASSTLLVSAATTLLDNALSYGIGYGLNELFGVGSDPVDLSQDSFDTIESIVGSVISTYFFSDYEADVNSALDYAEAYACDPLLLGDCIEEADEVHDFTVIAINQMEAVGLQGTASYGLLSALEITFLVELYELYGANGSQILAESTEALVASRAGDRRDHLEDMSDDWDIAVANLPNAYTKNLGNSLVFIMGIPMTKSTTSYCYEEFDGTEQCIGDQKICLCPFFGDCSSLGGSGWSCESASEEWSAVNQARDQLISDTHDAVLGADFVQLVDELAFYESGLWADETSGASFCAQFDGENVEISNSSGWRLAHGGFLYLEQPGSPGHPTRFTIDCQGTAAFTISSAFHGTYITAIDDANRTLAELQPLGPNAYWKPYLQPDGSWAIESALGTYLTLSGGTPSHDSDTIGSAQKLDLDII